MTIRRKMIIFPLVTILAVVSVGLISYRGLHHSIRSIDDIYSSLRSSKNIARVQKDLTQIHANAYKVVSWAASEYPANRIETLSKETLTCMGELIGFIAKNARSSITKAERDSYEEILAQLTKYREWINKTIDMAGTDVVAASLFLGSVEDQFNSANVEIGKWNDATDRLSSGLITASRGDYDRTVRRLLLAMVGVVLLSVIAAVLVALSIIRPISQVTEGLNVSVDEVATASAVIVTSSQQVAEGVSRQASAIEETSSSLEEMLSMIRETTNNASHAKSSIIEASKVVEEANVSMKELIVSMEEISTASNETQKIVKTIDEIAFQTNLLALNAAVEAARAGESGAGFAVVADEVRNLAMRAAEAARNTAVLIEGTVKKIKDGFDLVSKTNSAFSEVANIVSRAVELVAEISAASAEQALGIDQISKAAAELDRVVQRNAANAEESASSSEELTAQATRMQGFAESLVALVGADGSSKGKIESVCVGKEHVRIADSHAPPKTLLPHSGKGADKRNGSPVNGSSNNTGELAPKQVIPLDDNDFCDF